jgi:hypothetical protein
MTSHSNLGADSADIGAAADDVDDARRRMNRGMVQKGTGAARRLLSSINAGGSSCLPRLCLRELRR